MVCPSPRPAAMIAWTAAAGIGVSAARRAITNLAFGVGHRCCTDWFAGHVLHSESLRHDTLEPAKTAQLRFLKRQLSLPVSMMSQ